MNTITKQQYSKRWFKASLILFWILYNIFFVATAKGQDEGIYEMPPPPNAASLGKYGAYNVNLSSGTPNISIPIWEIKAGDLSVPISLQYAAKGIKVAEIASRVGLGWSMNAGGIITRTVRNHPDEGGYNTGFLEYANQIPLPSDLDVDKVNELASGYFDLEPDMYFYNFNGHTGRFVFDKNKEIRIISGNPIQIIPDLVEITGGYSFSKWTIITPDGVQYTFEDIELTSQGTRDFDGDNTQPVNSMGEVYKSSWYLSEIKSPSSNNLITFDYETYAVPAYRSSISEEKRYYQNGTSFNETFCSVTTVEEGRRLKKISFTGGEVVFENNEERKDFSGDYMLNAISIKNKAEEIKRFEFTHKYLNSNTLLSTTDPILSNIHEDKLRLMLTSVKEKSGSISKKPHIFEYFLGNSSNVGLPSRLSTEQDHWGFFNDNNSNTLIPAVERDGTIYTNANREASINSCKVGTLEKITYPTKGYTIFDYELHDVPLSANQNPDNPNIDQSADNYKIGGLRVKEIISYDTDGSEIEKKVYEYLSANGKSSGDYFDHPTYLTLPLYRTYYCDYDNFGGNYECTILPPLLQFKLSSYPIKQLTNTYGNSVTYDKVTVKTVGNGTEEHYFENTRDPLVLEGTTLIPNGGWLHKNSVDPNDNSPNTFTLKTDLFSKDEFPFPPRNSAEWLRGIPESILYKNEDGSIVKSIQYNYEKDYDWNDFSNHCVAGLKIGHYDTPHEVNSPCDPTYRYAYYFTGWGHKLLNSITETEYDENEDPTFSKVTSYTYNDQLVKSSETVSNGTADLQTTSYKYASDFDAIPPPYDTDPLSQMRQKNMIGVPIEVQQKKGVSVISSTYNNYTGTDYIQLSEVYQTENDNLMSSGWNDLDVNGYLKSNPAQYIRQAEYDYDSDGNVIQAETKGGKVFSILWSYNNTLPIAKIENAWYGEVAYTSFETGFDDSDFIGSNVTRTESSQAKTGDYYVTLNGVPALVSKTLEAGTYTLSYWATGSVSFGGRTATDISTSDADANGWRFYVKKIELGSAGKIFIEGNNINIDELRIYPSDAQMTTYTFEPLVGVTSITYPEGVTTKYIYDSLGRLVSAEDNDGNILQHYEYNYKD